jgi:hypothetical protein
MADGLAEGRELVVGLLALDGPKIRLVGTPRRRRAHLSWSDGHIAFLRCNSTGIKADDALAIHF